MVSNKDWVGNAKSIFVCNGASNHTHEEFNSCSRD